MGHDIDRPLIVPDVRLRAEDVGAGRDSRIAEEDVDRPEVRLDVGDQAVDCGLIADIALEGDPTDVCRDRFTALTVAVDDRDPRTARGECPA